jgi:hypothetical protein
MDATHVAFPPGGSPRLDGLDAEAAEPTWKGLYRTGGAAALATAAITTVGIAAHIIWPPPSWSPGAAVDWFALFQGNALRALVGLDLLFMAVYALLVPIYLALYVALRRGAESAMALAAALGFVAIAVYFASNPAFEMLSLSQGYAAATTYAQQAMFLAAGEAALAGFQGTAFKVSYLLASTAGVTIAAVILRSKILSRPTGYARLAASVLGLGLFVPVIGIPLALFSVLFEWAWYILLGRDLLRLESSI